MYFHPSFFAGVRPYETLHARERVDNPLDLSVKQTVTRPEGVCVAEHPDIQLMMESKLAVATSGLPSRSLTQQMPLLESMYTYKPFGNESSSCRIGGTATGLLGQSLANPFCTTGSSGPTINHFDILQQNRETLAIETAPPLTPFLMEASGHLPYHMRIGGAIANQRGYFGHSPVGAVLPPHMTGTFGSAIPHISLYTELLNDMTRRPVEPEKSIFNTMSSLRSPAEPTTRFSDHLQRLREQHLQQNKCSAPCCLSANGHTTGAQHLSATNGCNCCNTIPIAMTKNCSAMLAMQAQACSTPVHSMVSMSCKDVCNRELITNNTNSFKQSLNTENNPNESNDNNNNNNCFEDTSHQPIEIREFEHKFQSNIEIQTSKKTDIKHIGAIVPPMNSMKNVSDNCVVTQTDYRNTRHDNTDKDSDKCVSILKPIVKEYKNINSDKKNINILSESHDSNISSFSNKEKFASNQTIPNRSPKCKAKSETGIGNPAIDKTVLNAYDIITIDEDCLVNQSKDIVSNKNENINTCLSSTNSFTKILEKTQNSETNEKNINETLDSEKTSLICNASTTSSAQTSVPVSTKTTISSLDSIQISSKIYKICDSFDQNIIVNENKSAEAEKNQSQSIVDDIDGSADNKIFKIISIDNSAKNCQSVVNTYNKCDSMESIGADSQQSNYQFKRSIDSYFSNANSGSMKSELNRKDFSVKSDKINSESKEDKQKSINKNSTAVPKQLKDYKLLNKNQNFRQIDKNKRQPKETKTVEVQCDGPDWTPIVLPAQLMTKLKKVVKNKILCNDLKNNKTSKHFPKNIEKDIKVRKKCKQKHMHPNYAIHTIHNRSRSSSSSTASSRMSSPERKRQLFSNCESSSSDNSKKRSMLRCLVNSEGYVADKINKTGRQNNLFASDPSLLGREERALQV